MSPTTKGKNTARTAEARQDTVRMGKDSKISWTTDTWNPWIGCHKVSPGCKHCYAETLVMRIGRVFSIVRRAAPATFNAPLKWKPIRGDWGRGDILGDRQYVFTCSISDFFIEEADAWRDEAWEIIRRTPHLTYQILTKRPERIAEHLPKTCFKCGVGLLDDYCECPEAGKPWPNVWLGTRGEDQKYAEIRIPQLVELPAKVHFLSCEPLLGPIDFRDALPVWSKPSMGTLLNHIEWVIVGGESGPDFRPMDPRWAREIRAQCAAAGVPFFYKQGNGYRSEMNTFLDGKEYREMPQA